EDGRRGFVGAPDPAVPTTPVRLRDRSVRSSSSSSRGRNHATAAGDRPGFALGRTLRGLRGETRFWWGMEAPSRGWGQWRGGCGRRAGVPFGRRAAESSVEKPSGRSGRAASAGGNPASERLGVPNLSLPLVVPDLASVDAGFGGKC